MMQRSILDLNWEKSFVLSNCHRLLIPTSLIYKMQTGRFKGGSTNNYVFADVGIQLTPFNSNVQGDKKRVRVNKSSSYPGVN